MAARVNDNGGEIASIRGAAKAIGFAEVVLDELN